MATKITVKSAALQINKSKIVSTALFVEGSAKAWVGYSIPTTFTDNNGNVHNNVLGYGNTSAYTGFLDLTKFKHSKIEKIVIVLGYEFKNTYPIAAFESIEPKPAIDKSTWLTPIKVYGNPASANGTVSREITILNSDLPENTKYLMLTRGNSYGHTYKVYLSE